MLEIPWSLQVGHVVRYPGVRIGQYMNCPPHIGSRNRSTLTSYGPDNEPHTIKRFSRYLLGNPRP
jgi:hypothetical protein